MSADAQTHELECCVCLKEKMERAVLFPKKGNLCISLAAWANSEPKQLKGICGHPTRMGKLNFVLERRTDRRMDQKAAARRDEKVQTQQQQLPEQPPLNLSRKIALFVEGFVRGSHDTSSVLAHF